MGAMFLTRVILHIPFFNVKVALIWKTFFCPMITKFISDRHCIPIQQYAPVDGCLR